MIADTFAEQMVEKLEALLLKAAGHSSISVDGQAVTYSDLEAKYNYWKRQVARESGAKPLIADIDLSGF